MNKFHSKPKIDDREIYIYIDEDLPFGFVDYRPPTKVQELSFKGRLVLGIGSAPSAPEGELTMPDEEHHGTRSAGHDDAERRDDGLDAGALTGNQTTFRINDNAAIAESNALVQGILQAQKSADIHSHLERMAVVRSFNAGGVTATELAGIQADPDTPDLTDSPGAGQNVQAEFPPAADA